MKVLPGHYPWCSRRECIRHATSATEHQGPLNELPARGRHGDRKLPLLHSRLTHVRDMCPDTEISVTFYDEGTTYDAAEADELIADFETFLTGLKAQRAQLGQAAPAAEQVTA
ncbi:DUF6907 domain-containing protein [Actinacidiphila sp. ITFR-21]|uniref:DUF6907 domain-containing protein n=1 Tax=Actinacidiphila sp. ITFR-21 TaxID=3075199 RepID=UPI00288A1152|nr:hypothetical protein [Streptomyces sp. ITFR-21]WNI16945.1 hypothetical protein RLT57_16375 [Streptomyces sp. ITFR-21]